MKYKVTVLYPDGKQSTKIVDGVPDYASLNHALDHCEIRSFIVSLA